MVHRRKENVDQVVLGPGLPWKTNGAKDHFRSLVNPMEASRNKSGIKCVWMGSGLARWMRTPLCCQKTRWRLKGTRNPSHRWKSGFMVMLRLSYCWVDIGRNCYFELLYMCDKILKWSRSFIRSLFSLLNSYLYTLNNPYSKTADSEWHEYLLKQINDILFQATT